MIYKMTLTDSADSMTMDLLEVPIADTDVEGAVDNTTIDGNVFTDYLWLKKKYVQKWSIMCPDEYDRLRGFYTRQWTNASPAQYRLFYGKNIFTDYSESGDYIVVNNSSDISAPVTNFAMYGDATQQTYSGKNLASLKTSQTLSIDGVSFTIVNGVININGTTPNTNKNFYWDSFQVPQNGIAIFWANITGYTDKPSDQSSMVLQVSDDNSTWTNLLNINLKSTSPHSYTTTLDTTKYYRLRWYVSQNTFTNATIEVQLEYGSTKTSFEQYVGGVPSPNPDFPQEIHTVTGENTLKIVGKNIIELGGTSGSASFGQAVTITALDHNRFMLNGTATTNGWIEILTPSRFLQSAQVSSTILTPLIPTETYTASIQLLSGTFTQAGNASGFLLQRQLASGSEPRADFDSSTSFTNSGGIYRGWLRVMNGDTFNNAIFGVQVEVGSSATEFEDFSEQDAPITLTSKNLFGGLSFYVSSNVASYDFTDGILTITPTSASLNPNISFTLEKPIQAQTVHLSNNGISPSTATQLRDSSNNIVGNFGSSYDSTKTLSDVACRITFNWASTGSIEPFSSDLTKMQIEYGSSASSYTPYLNIRLAELGTFKDRINYDGVKWWIHKEINKLTFSGNEGWQLRNTQANGVVTYSWSFANAPEYYHSASATEEWKCSYLTNLGSTSGVSGMYSKGVGFCPYYNNTQPTTVSLYFNTMDSTLANFKVHIAGNEILYPLATPTDTEITDSNLLSQLNAIYELYVKSGKNSILIMPTSPNLQPDFDIGYRVFSEQETDIVSIVPVRLGLTDDGVINTCGCRRNIQLTMRETIQ